MLAGELSEVSSRVGDDVMVMMLFVMAMRCIVGSYIYSNRVTALQASWRALSAFSDSRQSNTNPSQTLTSPGSRTRRCVVRSTDVQTCLS
jgi:hypothetical protein